jgi:hypothetical protein
MAINTGDLNSLYKVAYAKGIEDLLPWKRKIADLVDFVPSELQNGKQYEQPVILTGEQGFTYSLDTQSAYDLNDSIGMAMQSAIVPGADVVLDSTVGYNQAARASHSATSFKTVMSTKFENMLKSSSHRLEIAYLYGQTNIGSAALQSVTIANSMLPIVIDTASWATGIWSGLENANVVFAVAADNTAVDSLRSFKVAKVDVDARTIYFAAGTAGTAGTLTTLETAIEAGALNIHFYGSVSGSAGTFAYAEMAGLKKIMTNTGSLFGIDAASYDLWRGNSVAVTGQLTMAKVLSAVAKPVQRGLEEDVVCFVNPSTWADLASNLAALRRFDGSYSKSKAANGSEQLEYISQNGTIKIMSYNIVKEGDCFIFPVSKTLRIGARELSLNDPTRPADEIFFTIPGKAGVGVRAYTNQAIFVEAPAQTVYISGIVNSNAA